MWDLRLPAGLFFFGLGLMLCIYAFVFPAMRPVLAPEVNVNLFSGLAMGVFGAVMLLLAWRGRK
jgi:hypothetical protein